MLSSNQKIFNVVQRGDQGDPSDTSEMAEQLRLSGYFHRRLRLAVIVDSKSSNSLVCYEAFCKN